ncbi:hypothetical protein CHCC20442_4326 [Bacillus licheniformis]|uniref:hypothetical protein n=1 Tax=Bacillus licheniformis TaxID=1402 RepID=UPI00119DE0FB|nr:hypothetical protein [Bacillus licheniformis]TWK08613.1 hypothetical protein CHCC20442_4326 [Bacillus licheniformis]
MMLKGQADVSEIKKVKTFGRRVWKEGALVICRTRKEIFEAKIIGFKENSAMVEDKRGERRVVSYRNMLDPESNKPLKKTPKKEAISNGGNYLTAYIPTEKEQGAWKKRAGVKLFN